MRHCSHVFTVCTEIKSRSARDISDTKIMRKCAVLRPYCAGGVMHSIGDYQDTRFMCILYFYMPFTSSCLMASNFALCGMPFLDWILF